MAVERWFAKSNGANKAAPSDRAAFTKGDPVMMGQNLHGSFRMSTLDRRGDERRRALRSSGITSTYLRPAAYLARTVGVSSREQLLAAIPLGRLGSPAETARRRRSS